MGRGWKLTFAWLPVDLWSGRLWLGWYWRSFCGDCHEVEPIIRPMPNMRKAFHTSHTCGPEKIYEMRFKFRSLDDLQAAEDEWRNTP